MGEVDRNLVTTAFELPGCRIVRNLGVVRGLVVRSRSRPSLCRTNGWVTSVTLLTRPSPA